MDKDEVIRQFDDIEEKVDYLIEFCKSLESTNSDLKRKIEDLETQLQGKKDEQEKHLDQNAFMRSKVDSLLSKLNNYSELS